MTLSHSLLIQYQHAGIISAGTPLASMEIDYFYITRNTRFKNVHALTQLWFSHLISKQGKQIPIQDLNHEVVSFTCTCCNNMVEKKIWPCTIAN